MRRTWLCILLLLPLIPAGAVQASGIKVSPSLTLREEYNDNIFLEKDAKEDFITTVAPYLSVFLDRRSIDLKATYGFEFRLYRNQSELDETEPGDAQRARLNADLFPDRDFTVNVLDEFLRVVVDERRPSIEENVVVNRTNYNIFRVNPRYRYRRWKTFTPTLSYEYENRNYEGDMGDDSERQGAGLELEKRFSERLRVTTGYNYSIFNSDTEDDYRRDDVHAGFVYRPGSKLTLNTRGGVAIVDRNEGGEDTERLLSVTADYAQTEEIHLKLAYDETVYDSVDSGLVLGRTASATLEHHRRLATDVTLTAREVDYLDTDRDDRSLGAAVQTTLPLSNRISIRVRPYTTWFEFRPEEDHVVRYGVGISIQKEFKYGYLRLGYDHHASENDKLFNDYRNNIVFLEAVSFWGGASDRARQLQGYYDSEIPNPKIQGREYKPPNFGY